MREDEFSEYEAVVHERWQYYGPRFERFARGKWLSWNWSACLATFAWLHYRKMYAWSMAYFFVSATVFVAIVVEFGSGMVTCAEALDGRVAPTHPDLRLLLTTLLCLGWIVPPILANRLYFNHVRRVSGKAGRSTGTGTGTGTYLGAVLLQFAILGILAALAIPADSAYSHFAIVSGGVTLAAGAKTPIEDYVNEHRRPPARIDAVTDKTSSELVDRLMLDSDGTIRAIFGQKAGKFAGHTVSLVPVNENGRIVDWVCRSDDLPLQCLPPRCRIP
jgi:type IV pilus assembly protein PilA